LSPSRGKKPREDSKSVCNVNDLLPSRQLEDYIGQTHYNTDQGLIQTQTAGATTTSPDVTFCTILHINNPPVPLAMLENASIR